MLGCILVWWTCGEGQTSALAATMPLARGVFVQLNRVVGVCYSHGVLNSKRWRVERGLMSRGKRSSRLFCAWVLPCGHTSSDAWEQETVTAGWGGGTAGAHHAPIANDVCMRTL